MTHSSPSIGYQNIPANSNPQPEPTYQLRRYLWRSALSIIGPILLLAFWSFICFYYLNRQPENKIVLDVHINARGPFYAWTATSVFALDWARSALANFQAAAIMRPRWAPANAMDLFWHADDNWANPLWWFRAIRNSFLTYVSQHRRSRPAWFWCLLSLIFLFVFIAIPLGGLAMELTQILTPGHQRAQILGPMDTTFNIRGWTNPASTVYGLWKAGGVATPPDNSYFYAPEKTFNVSLTYFEDSTNLDNTVTFLGPAVNDLVVGTTYGVESWISCSQVRAEDLGLIVVHDIGNYTLSSKVPVDTLWFDETGYWNGRNIYSMVAAADGTWYGSTPYTNIMNFDGYNNRPIPGKKYTKLSDLPDSYLEFYIYQGVYPNFTDPVIDNLLQNQSSMYRKTNTAPNITGLLYDEYTPFTTVGFGVQCRVRSAYGSAQILPTSRTYSNFTFANTTSTGSDQDVFPPETIAVQALGNFGVTDYKMHPRNPAAADSTWLAMHPAINQPVYCTSNCSTTISNLFNKRYAYMSLSPQNVTFALQRLLGKSLVVMMSAGSQGAWEGDLYLLESSHWLTPGVVPWRPVLILLGLWTIATSGVSIWTVFTRRWAPTLSGFELFRFGAQYTEQVDKLDSQGFEECHELENIPGMVGVLPVESMTGTDGFIGLSELAADLGGQYVYNRKAAGKHRTP